MTYQDSENSVASGQPVELYDFFDEDGNHNRITSADHQITYNGRDYYPEDCDRTELRLTDNASKNELTVKVSRDNPFFFPYLSGPIDSEVVLILYRGHEPDFETEFIGDLTRVKFTPEGVPLVSLQQRTTSTTRTGRRRRCQRTCGVSIYDAECQVNRESFKVTGTIDSVNGNILTSNDFGISPTYEARGDITGLTGCVYNASSTASATKYPASAAFDNALGQLHHWRSAQFSVTNQWVSCQWTSGKTIRIVQIQPCAYDKYSDYNPRHVKIEGSNNGTAWSKVPIVGWLGRCAPYNTDEAEIEQIADYEEWVTFRLNNSTPYTYYRVYIYDNWGSSSYVALSEIEMHEFDSVVVSTLQGGEIIVGTAKRFIKRHEGTEITITRLIPGIQAGDNFTAYRGCDHTPYTCEIVFDNKINYAGEEHLTHKNPFVGDPII